MRSSNSPRYFEPATIDDRSRETSFLPRRESGTSPSTMRRASPSTTAVLPTPGSPISTGLFLVRRESTWTTRRISASRPITGSRRPSRASSVRSTPYFSRLWKVLSGFWVSVWFIGSFPGWSLVTASRSARGPAPTPAACGGTRVRPERGVAGVAPLGAARRRAGGPGGDAGQLRRAARQPSAVGVPRLILGRAWGLGGWGRGRAVLLDSRDTKGGALHR